MLSRSRTLNEFEPSLLCFYALRSLCFPFFCLGGCRGLIIAVAPTFVQLSELPNVWRTFYVGRSSMPEISPKTSRLSPSNLKYVVPANTQGIGGQPQAMLYKKTIPSTSLNCFIVLFKTRYQVIF